MPVYDYECMCGTRTTAYRTINDREHGPSCPDCGGDTRKMVSRSNINPDIFDGTYDPNLSPMFAGEGHGTWLKSRAHRKERMRELGLVEI